MILLYTLGRLVNIVPVSGLANADGDDPHFMLFWEQLIDDAVTLPDCSDTPQPGKISTKWFTLHLGM